MMLVRIDPEGRFTQYLMDAEYPVILSTTSNPGNPLRFGAGAQFFPSTPLPMYDNGVLQLERLGRAPVVVGYIASAAAILIGFVPPSQFENGSDAAYIGLILAGTVLLGLLPPWLFLKRRKPSWKVADAEKAS